MHNFLKLFGTIFVCLFANLGNAIRRYTGITNSNPVTFR